MKETTSETLKANCPECKGVIESRIPPAGDMWDTLMSCPHCKEILWKVVTHTEFTLSAGPGAVKNEGIK